MKIPAFIGNMLDLLYPRECHCCGGRLAESEKFICEGCIASLPRTLYHTRKDNPMEQRFAGLIPFERASGHFFYTHDSELAGLIHDFKYRRFPGLAHSLGRIVGREILTSGFLSDADVIVPVPMYWLKEAGRGYNQSAYLAYGIGEATGIRVSRSLKAIKGHKTQTSLSHRERLDNTRGIFRLSEAEDLRDRHILLVDDVCTTGATLTAAAEAILAAIPDARISLLSLAVTF